MGTPTLQLRHPTNDSIIWTIESSISSFKTQESGETLHTSSSGVNKNQYFYTKEIYRFRIQKFKASDFNNLRSALINVGNTCKISYNLPHFVPGTTAGTAIENCPRLTGYIKIENLDWGVYKHDTSSPDSQVLDFEISFLPLNPL